MKNDNATASKHHEYQIYYGGFKILIKDTKYCKDCNYIYNSKDELLKHKKQQKINVRSHKKQTEKPRVRK